MLLSHSLQGSTLELDEAMSAEWIRLGCPVKSCPKELSALPQGVFADLSLMSNVVCLFWDRFAAGTAGGKWSGARSLSRKR